MTGFVLDSEVQKAIEGKQVANQKLAQKATEVDIAKKEAERLQALQDAITPNTLMKEAIDKWDGSGIPPTVGGNLNLFVQQPSK